MSKTWRKLLSVLLALSMIVSLTVTGYATGNSSAASSAKASSGTKLELEEIDPSTLAVPRVGRITEDIAADEEEDLYAPDDIVRVTIALDGKATLEKYPANSVTKNIGAIAYRAGLKRQQQEVTRQIETAIGRQIDVKWNLTLAMNAISANVRYGDIAAIRTIAGVKGVQLEQKYEPQVDEVNTAVTTEYMVGAKALWEEGYTGAGSRVAIIDTGTDHEHLSFDPEALEYALEEAGGDYNLLTWDEISGLAGQLNVSVTEQVYKNTKIPYAYNYVDGNYTTDHMSDTQGEHGSHVSGIAAANRYVKVDGEFVDAVSAVGAVGVAPDAQIITMKVFGAGGGAYDSDYMVAIEDAIVLGCDSVNLSLGSGAAGFSLSPGYQNVMDSLVGSGTVVTISSGNSGGWFDTPYNSNMYPYLYMEDVGYHTGGSPGSFINAFTIASADNIGANLTPLFFNGDEETPVSYSETSGNGNEPIATIAGTYDYVLLDGPGVGVDPANPDVDANENVGKEGDAFWALGSEVLTGKVAICYRGTSSFFAKANAAMGQGAAALIVINNQDGVINMNLTGYEYTAPVVSILKAVGDELKANSEAVTDEEGNVLYYTGTVTVADESQNVLSADRDGANMSSFSSWGVPGSLILKPELTTPGGSIYSVWGANKGDSSPTDSHEDYEMMSGTSMAAPHAAGMAALVAQYIRENDLLSKTDLDQRALINSLLMSTATPMFDTYGEFVPVMQQGAGLGEAHLATMAKSYITMNEDATASYADGKVKVELGQDAAREGVYTFSYNINNYSDVEMSYELDTSIFTQFIAGNAGYGMLQDPGTIELNKLMEEGFGEALDGYTVEYDYPTRLPNEHDVNVDGETNKDDAQAILDKMTGEYPEDADFDEKAADLDGDGKYTSYDAHLLLVWLDETDPGLVVPAGESVTVGVTITLSDDAKEILDYYYSCGAYIEGYTYVIPTTETEDGEILGVEHSIPILGYYGSWTDASMFDAVSPVEHAYGSPKLGYVVNGYNTNYLTVNYGKANEIFMGNPYTIEDEFPAERLALNSKTKLVDIKYNLIRNAATTGVLALDGEGNVLKSSITPGQTYSAYYYVNGGAWQNTSTRTAGLGYPVSTFGLSEGDTFLLGYFAVPEYYGMMLHPGDAGVTAEEIAQLLNDGELGEGAYVGYTFTVDDTAPVIDEVTINEDKTVMSVTAHDNAYIAYITLMDINGNVELVKGVVPEQAEPGETVTVEFEITEELGNAVAVVVGDYASNEDIKLGKISDGPITAMKTVYVPVTTLEEGKNYIFVSALEAGDAKAIALPTGSATYGAVVPSDVVVKETADGQAYVETEDSSIMWTASASGENFHLGSVANPAEYLGSYSSSDGKPLYYWSYPYDSFNVSAEKNGALYLPLSAATNLWIIYDEAQDSVAVHRTAETYFYAFGEGVIEEEINLDEAQSITVTPEENVLVMGTTESVQLTAEVKPILLEDKSVTWESSNEEVATVDENGLVTAVAPGEVEITATTNAEPHLSASAKVTVIEVDAPAVELRGTIFGADSKAYWSKFMTDAPAEWTQEHEGGYYYAGTLIGDKLYVIDEDNALVRVDADVYEPTVLVDGLASSWIFSDAAEVPYELSAAWGYEGYILGGVCNGGTYFEILNPDTAGLIYFNLSDTFGDDPLAAITAAGWYNDSTFLYFAITEGGEVYALLVTAQGQIQTADMGSTGIELAGVVSLENQASLLYDPEADFLYLSYYDGNGDTTDLYAIDPWDPMYTAKQGDFGSNVWPVTSLYQYEPQTDLSMEVNPTEVTVREGGTAQVEVFIKLGETNEFTTSSSDETIATMDENGVITGIKEGECVITVTTVDTNAAGEHLTADINVTVEAAAFAGFYFEDEDEVGQWTFVDSDGDGNNWIWTPENSSFSSMEAYEGAGMILSQSYINGTGALTPDNWAISPAIDMSELEGEVALSLYAKGQDASWCQEKFALYAGTSADPNEMTKISDDFTATGDWVQYTADLSEFAGADEVYVAIRHYDCTDMYMLDVDQVEVIVPSLKLKVSPTDVTVGVGESVALDIQVTFGETNEFTVESANESIATFDSKTNSVVGVAAGETTLTVTTVDVDSEGNPKTATVNVAVVQKAGSFDFEIDPATTGWTFIDKDGDGFNWGWDDSSSTPHMSPYEGVGCIYSESYDNDSKSALNPDNWAISPAIDMSELNAPSITFYAKGQDPDWCQEVFAVYAGTSADPDSMTKVSDDFTATGEYTMYSADLSDFAGADEVYVAIRHYNVSNMFVLVVDNVEIVDGAPTSYTAPEQHTGAQITLIGDGFVNLKTGTEFTRSDESIPAVRFGKVMGGSLNVFTGAATATRNLPALEKSAIALESDEENVTINITEDVNVTNGTYEVTYDPELLTYVGNEAEHDTFSIHVDEEKGVISIAFADLDETEAGETLVALKFTVACEDTEVTVTTTERNDETELEETETVAVEGIGHDWGEPEWTWAEDYSTATATFVCGNNDEHVEEIEAAVTSETTDATCTEDGETVYTATVTGPDGNEYTDTKTETIDATGHTEGEPVIENEVEATCTEAGSYDEVVYCEVCGEELSRETVTVDPLGHTEGEPVIENEVEATCTEPGSHDEVVYCEVCGEELSRETVTVDPIGHAWGEPTWAWEGDTVTATFVCQNDESHVMEVKATVTAETTDPTCDEDGKVVYTATVTVDGEEYTTSKTVTLPAMGHDWGEPVWTWSDDHKTATATFTCTKCGETFTVTDSAILTDTTEDGKITYTASVVGPDGKTYTTTFVGSVDTGDAMNLSLYFGLMLISAAGAIVVLRAMKKKEN